MERITWTPERINQVHKYMKVNDATVLKASKAMKFSQAAYYVAKKKLSTKSAPVVKRAHNKRPKAEPMTLELMPRQSGNNVILLIANKNQLKNLLAELL